MSEDDCDYEEEDVISMKSMGENISCEERSVTFGSASADSKNFLDEHYQPLLFGYYDKPKCLRIGDWPALTPAKRDKLKLRQLQIKKANIKYLYENRMVGIKSSTTNRSSNSVITRTHALTITF